MNEGTLSPGKERNLMKLWYDKRVADPIYYAQQGVRNGKKVSSKNVKRIGKHSELLKITDDPLAYAQAEIARMNEEYRVGRVQFDLKCDFNERVKKTERESSRSTAVNTGYFFLQNIMGQLKLKEFFSQITSDRKMTYSCYDINRFLTYARILDPRSKYGTWDHLDTYYEKPDFSYHHIIRFMDVLEEHYDEYLTWLYQQSNNVVPRQTSVMYYDCTNFYFETEREDEEVIDPVTGEIMKGLRQYGVSKEHRPNPIVEMGLFMDQRGIPVSMCLHPGNTSEQLTAVPLERDIVKMLGTADFIYCSDAGLGSYNIRKFNSLGGRAFIVTQSIKKLSDVLKEAIFEGGDYRLLSDDTPVSISHMKEFDRFTEENLPLYNDFAYKVIEAGHVVDLGLYEMKHYKNGTTRRVKATGLLKQRLIVTFSRKMMEYQRAVRTRQIERARKIVAANDPEEIKKGPNDVRRFMKRIAQAKNGEKASVTYIIDEAKIAEEEKYDGFYAVATNLEDDARKILAISKKRYQIEDCFRIMKTNFSGRPVNHRNPDRIKAHFLICYTALLVYRLLEAKLDDQGSHITTDDLINTLKNMSVVNVHDVEYMALYEGSKALDVLTQLTGLVLDRLHYRPKELNQMLKKYLK
jgi:transposase